MSEKSQEMPENVPGSQTFDSALQGFRERIDAMDDELIDLIKRRCEIVQEVGKLKEAHLDTRCFIRPGREATMIRRISQIFEDHAFSTGAAASIWRMIIAASTSIEQPLRITSYFTPNEQDSYWLAREYFGMFSNIGKENTPTRVIGRLMDNSALVGVVPQLETAQDEPWWRLLMERDARTRPNIFACLPYAVMETDSSTSANGELRPQALAVGYVDCEPTGNDVTYLVIDGKHELSQSRIHSFFTSANQNARWLQVLPSPASDSRLHLIELEGFFTERSTLINELNAQCGDQLQRVAIIGAHARPILLKS
jgi:chorismate mutase/prephenate dehydratase